MGKIVDFSLPMSELLSQGGSLVNPGPYRVEVCDFRLYDFNKPGNDSLVLYQKIQPVDADGNDEGEALERRWPTNDKLRDGTIVLAAKSPVKGRKGSWSQLEFTEANSFGRIYGLSAFGVFLQHCEIAEVDMDAIGNDITAFEGNVYEYGIYNYPERKATAVEEAEGEGGDGKKKYPKQEVVITGVPKKGKKGPAKPKAKKEEEEEEEDKKPAKKAAKKGKDTPESLLVEFLNDSVCTDENEDGADHMSCKLMVGKWLTAEKSADPETVRAVVKLYNDVEDALPAALATLGWHYAKKTKTIMKDED